VHSVPPGGDRQEDLPDRENQLRRLPHAQG